MNSRMQGGTGVGKAISYFMNLGYLVFVPLVDYPDYDLVVDMLDNGLKKIQVRTTTYKSEYGIYQVNLRVCGGNTREYKIHKTNHDMVYDYLFISVEDGRMYLIPKEKITQKNCINLSTNVEEFKI